MMSRLKFYWLAYRDEERGSIAIETVLIIPALFWAWLAMFAIFDAYRQYSINQKAAYTIGDMVSRETAPIDDNYIKGMRDMLKYLTNTRQTTDVAIRISSVQYDEEDDIYALEWSEIQGTFIAALAEGETNKWHDRLPILPDNERITIVETFVKYDPPFDTGLSDRIVRNFVFTRPRYAPCVQFDDGSITSC